MSYFYHPLNNGMMLPQGLLVPAGGFVRVPNALIMPLANGGGNVVPPAGVPPVLPAQLQLPFMNKERKPKPTKTQKITHARPADRWDYHFELLLRFKEQFGHTRVPPEYKTEEGARLGLWVKSQHNDYVRRRKGLWNRLNRERIQKLNGIVFEWIISTEPRCIQNHGTWDDNYQALVEFKEKHGHTRVPVRLVTKDGIKLGEWVNRQRYNYRKKEKGLKCSINEERMQKLKEIGLEQSLFGDLWESKYQCLVTFKEKYGHTQVPLYYQTKDGVTLGMWVVKQRRDYMKAKKGVKTPMTPERLKKLEAIGFSECIKNSTSSTTEVVLESDSALVREYKRNLASTQVPPTQVPFNSSAPNGLQHAMWTGMQQQHAPEQLRKPEESGLAQTAGETNKNKESDGRYLFEI